MDKILEIHGAAVTVRCLAAPSHFPRGRWRSGVSGWRALGGYQRDSQREGHSALLPSKSISVGVQFLKSAG